MRYGDLAVVCIFFTRVPFTLKIFAVLRSRFTIPHPVGQAVVVDEHVGPDDLVALVAQNVHQHGITLLVDIFDNPENPAFRVYGADAAVIGNPHLGEVVAHKMVAGHGGGGFAATARRCTGAPCFAATGSVDAGDEHVLGQLVSPIFINSLVHGKSVVAFF